MAFSFHQGEIEVHRLLGLSIKSEDIQARIRDHFVQPAVDFLKSMHFIILSTLKEDSDLWSTIVFGNEFITILSDKTLAISLDHTALLPKEYINDQEKPYGILAIDFEGAQRLRLNGNGFVQDNVLYIEILELYSNCPKYIQKRKLTGAFSVKKKESFLRLPGINEELKIFIEQADTFFIGSYFQKMDISHRGGNPGFIKVLSDNTLSFPDYSGNKYYNTLGNILLNPSSFLLFIDFKNGRTIHLQGESKVMFENEDNKVVTNYEELENKSEVKIKSIQFKCETSFIDYNGFPFEYELITLSTFNPI